MIKAEAVLLNNKLTECLDRVKQLLLDMDVLDKNLTLNNDQKLEELQKIRDELNKVTLEIDSVKKGIKLLSTRHLN